VFQFITSYYEILLKFIQATIIPIIPIYEFRLLIVILVINLIASINY